MAQANLIAAKWGDSDSAWLRYNDVNNRLNQFNIELSAGRTVRLLLWDTDAGGNPSDPATALFDQTWVGPVTDSITVPGNYRLVEVTDPGGTYLDVPPNFVYQFLESMSG